MTAPRRRSESLPASLEEARLRNVPPQNLAAEQAILGGVLRKMSLLDKLGVELRPADFYSPAHRMVWEAMLDLWRASKPVDLITLAATLTAAGRLDAVGGPAYLGELAGSTFSPANSPHHAGIVRAMAKRRAMLDMAMRMIEIAYDPERDPADFVSIAQAASDAVLQDRLDTHGETPDEFLDPYTAYLEKLEESGGGGMGYDFRVESTWRTHPKFILLRQLYGSEGIDAIFTLWAFVAEERNKGVLENMSDRHIAAACCIDQKVIDPSEFVADLIEIGFLDRRADQIVVVHNWEKRQPNIWGRGEKNPAKVAAANARWQKNDGKPTDKNKKDR